MPRSALLASVVLHSGMLALVSSLTLHKSMDGGFPEHSFGRLEKPAMEDELVAAEPPLSQAFDEALAQPHEHQSAGARLVSFPATAVQTVAAAPRGDFSLPIAPSAPLRLPTPASLAADRTAKGPARKSTATRGRTADLARDEQPYAPARYASCPPPAYPAEARKARLSGTVLLLVQIDESGRPLGIEVRQTSGHQILDTAALRAVRAWRFEPARRGGKPVPARVEIPLRFVPS